MVERRKVLSPGFLVKDYSHSTDFRPSDSVDLPVRLADAFDLFAQMGILREGRAFLVLGEGVLRGKRKGSRALSVWLSDEQALFSVFSYADQALLLQVGDNTSFGVDQFIDWLFSQARTAYSGGGLTRSNLGLYCILRLVFDRDRLSDEQALELIEIGAPLANVVSLWSAGATVDVIRDTVDIPDFWLKRMLGDFD